MADSDIIHLLDDLWAEGHSPRTWSWFRKTVGDRFAQRRAFAPAAYPPIAQSGKVPAFHGEWSEEDLTDCELLLTNHQPAEYGPGAAADLPIEQALEQGWVQRATLDAGLGAPAREVLTFVFEVLERLQGPPPNWAWYPAVVGAEFQKRRDRTDRLSQHQFNNMTTAIDTLAGTRSRTSSE